MNSIDHILQGDPEYEFSCKIKRALLPDKPEKGLGGGGNEQSARNHYKTLLINIVITHTGFVIAI